MTIENATDKASRNEPATPLEQRSDPVCAGAPEKASVPAMPAIKATHPVPPKPEASAPRQPSTPKETPPLRPAQSSGAMFGADCMTFLSIAEGGPGLDYENKKLRNPIQARPYPVPPEDLFSRLAAVSRSPMNWELTSDTRILCNIADDVIRERGLDSFTESIFKVMLSTVGKQIMLVSVRCDLENNRLGTGSRDEPIARARWACFQVRAPQPSSRPVGYGQARDTKRSTTALHYRTSYATPREGSPRSASRGVA